ncbi:MAG: hypothetical protein QOE58_1548 [Actinomycetota bacterium]|nr:hypothetical protein [Actinomycetota bacterium]
MEGLGQVRHIRIEARPLAGGRSRVIEVRVRPDWVDVFDDGKHAGLIERDAVRLWLADSRTPLTIDDVALGWNGLTLVLFTLRGEFELPSTVEAALREEPSRLPLTAGLAMRRRPPFLASTSVASPAIHP